MDVLLKSFLLLITLFFPLFSYAMGHLENPAENKTESGIGIISGWHCTATKLDIYIDGQFMGTALVGTPRTDTINICGRSDTGFSLLFNYNSLNSGDHTIVVFNGVGFVDGYDFSSISSVGEAEGFIFGLSNTTVIDDFPEKGMTSTLEWRQSKQSFVIINVEKEPGVEWPTN